MVVPSATALDELAGLNGCGGPEDRDQFTMTTDLDPEDAKSGIWAMEGHTFDQPRKRFAVMISVGGIFLETHGASMLETGRKS